MRDVAGGVRGVAPSVVDVRVNTDREVERAELRCARQGTCAVRDQRKVRRQSGDVRA